MVRAAYSRAYAVAVAPPFDRNAGSSCINMVIAGAIANISVGALFVGGFIQL
jgi:TRAP-type C4-dicarboxylate transport system permease large subunit